MHDKNLILEILEQIYDSAQKVLKRFEPIKSVNDFTDSEAGMEKLDAICMQLIAIGEALKNLDKLSDDSLLPKYPQIDWKKVNNSSFRSIKANRRLLRPKLKNYRMSR